MGASLMASCPVARHMVEQVDEALGGELLSIMTNGPEDELKMTRNAQPALMATAVATVRSLEKATGKSIDQMADFVAGHSLGEYSAMTAVHVFDIEVAARLLRHRGDAMQAAVPAGEGAMAALLGVDVDAVENILAGVDGLLRLPMTTALDRLLSVARRSLLTKRLRRRKMLALDALCYCRLARLFIVG